MAQPATAGERAAARRSAPRHRAGRPAGGIRWDRVARVALLFVLGVILLLYISPISHWVNQSRTASEQRSELGALDRDNRRLRARIARLRRPDALEREARRLGMVRRGERPFVVQSGRR